MFIINENLVKMENVVVISNATYEKVLKYFSDKPMAYRESSPFVHALITDKTRFDATIEVKEKERDIKTPKRKPKPVNDEKD